jgi:Cu(I)/Ag(I) efflux system membrane fusion protein
MKKMKPVFVMAVVVSLLIFNFLLFTSCGNASKEKQLYTCPMHPYYITDRPGDCPICGMKLVKVEPESQKSKVKSQNEGAGPKENAQAPDRVVVKIDPDRQQLINIRTDAVAKRNLGNAVLAAGVVAYDPELYYTQQQLISASLSLRKARAGGDESGITAAKDALNSAETRLKVMGLSNSQINELSTKAEPDKSLLISDQGGNVWVYAQVYQDDLKYVKRGAEAEVTLSSAAGEIFTGKVVAIDPALNPETRSVRVRILVKNTGGAFKPEMYVNVKIKSTIGNFLSVPEEAIMDTGSRQVVFVDKGGGYFEPRYVVLGAKIDEYYVVQMGLAEGEKVAVNANFLIDSESQLKAALGQMGGELKH